jgi:hypothetical protein
MMMPALLLLLLLLLLAATGSAGAPPPPPPASRTSVLSAGRRALAGYTRINGPLADATCAWTDSTLLIGAIALSKVSKDAGVLQDAEAWGRKQGYRVCGEPKSALAVTALRSPLRNGTASGDDSCSVAVRDVAYTGAPSGKPLAGMSFGDCCERCGALGYPKCTYFTWHSATRQCSLQTANTVPRRSPGDLSGWPAGGPCPPQCRHVAGGVRGPHGANSQLCGASYIELAGLTHNATLMENTVHVLAEEVANPSSVSDWSWVDALFMSMNTYSRLAAATATTPSGSNDGVPATGATPMQLFEKQWSNFHQAALAPADNLTAYGFWNASASLFYRDSRFYGTEIFWGRGNAWAIGALVAAIQYGNATTAEQRQQQGVAAPAVVVDPHWTEYVAIFRQHAAKLRSIISDDGAWRPSLLHPADYPLGETTATAGILYGLAFGLNRGLLTPRADYLPAVTKAWSFLATTALQGESTSSMLPQPPSLRPSLLPFLCFLCWRHDCVLCCSHSI